MPTFDVQINNFLCTLVVAGSMNPAIHHPAWYQRLGLVTQEEFDLATGRSVAGTVQGPVISTNPMSTFSFRNFVLNCNPAQWIMQSQGRGFEEKILNFAKTAFGQLPETPITAFGINAEGHVSLPGVNIAEALRKGMQGAVFLESSPVSQVRYQVTQTIETGALTTVLEKSNFFNDSFFYSFNYHFDVPELLAEGQVSFDLGELIEPRFSSSLLRFDSILGRIIDTVVGWGELK